MKHLKSKNEINKNQIKKQKKLSKHKQKLKKYRIEKQQKKCIAYQIHKTILHFFPDLFTQMQELEDCRKKKKYDLSAIITACLALFIFKTESRNELNNLRQEGNFKKNYKILFKLPLPHMDTVNRVMEKIKTEQLEKLQTIMVRSLFEKKVFHKFRFMNKWTVVAVDATGTGNFPEGHCNQCLHKTSKNGVISCFHSVLDAKLVTSNGFAISIATEWIENHEGDYDKQDCELKAFKRLSETLKKRYPRLPICIAADSLYPCTVFFDICKKNAWAFIITFKEGKIPTIAMKAEEAWNLEITDTPVYITTEGNTIIQQNFRWVNKIHYGNHEISWLECTETKTGIKTEKIEVTRFVHLSNISVEKNTVKNISFTGRLRWKIENEGFNCQKNHGYRLEHKYSRTSNTAMKNYYCCLQIAHLINQLVILSQSFEKNLIGKITVKHLWICLTGFLIYGILQKKELTRMANKKIQIRFIT